MYGIGHIGLVQGILSVFHGLMIVHQRQVLFPGILADEGVQFVDERTGIADFPAPADFRSGQHGAQHGTDAVELSQFHHGHQVPEGILHLDVAVVPGNVVDAGQDAHVVGFQFNHVRAEAGQHLQGSLAADAASLEVMGKQEVVVVADPVAGDGITKKDGHGPLFHLLVGVFILREIGPVLVNRNLCVQGQGEQQRCEEE